MTVPMPASFKSMVGGSSEGCQATGTNSSGGASMLFFAM